MKSDPNIAAILRRLELIESTLADVTTAVGHILEATARLDCGQAAIAGMIEDLGGRLRNKPADLFKLAVVPPAGRA